jgi:hypothetical protein
MDNGQPMIPERPPMPSTNSARCDSLGCVQLRSPGSLYCAKHTMEGPLKAQHDRDVAMIAGKPLPPETVAAITKQIEQDIREGMKPVFTIPEGTKGPTKLDDNGDMIFKTRPEQSSGGDNDYWVANVTEPKRLAPYKAEAEDLIELFQFSFAEGNAFKALWRMGMDRVASGKPGDTPLRNAEKVAYYGSRMVKAEQKKLK